MIHVGTQLPFFTVASVMPRNIQYNMTNMANVNSGLTTSARWSIDLVGHQFCYVVMWYTQGWDFYHPQP